MTRLSTDTECDGLLPQNIPDPVVVTMPTTVPPGTPSGTLVCQATTSSDGSGAVAIAWLIGPGWARWLVFADDGRQVGTFASTHAANTPGVRDPLPQQRGWLSVSSGSLFSPYDVVLHVLRPDGSETRTVPIASSAGETRTYGAYLDPNGGVMVVIAGPTAERATGCFGESWRFDGAGNPLSSPSDVPCRHTAGGVSRSSDALVLGTELPDAELAGQTVVTWMRRDGQPLARATNLEEPDVFMLPLLDGSILAYAGDRTWLYEHLATATVAPPRWLVERAPPSWQLRFTRGNRGYALFRRAMYEDRPCDPAVELRAPSGRLCGTLTFLDAHGACVAGRADQGWDGTVVQNTSISPCEYRWWPRLLAGP